MGCCKGKQKRGKVNLQGNESFDKEDQERKLNEILQRINTEIETIKEGVFKILNN